jgi:hypothetical protein
MTLRRVVLVALALLAGLAVALVDSSPGWDSTGITAGLLLLSAGTTAAIAGDRPWLWALLVGVPTPAIELATSGNGGSILALAFAAGGAAIGWAIGRAARGSAEGSFRK